MKKYIIIICLNSLFILSGFAQTSSEILLLKDHSTVHKHNFKEEASKNKSEYELLFSGLFLFYKTFISSQDGNSCSFTPSCSVYGIHAVKSKGAVIGMVCTFDRLTRCNGMKHTKYPIHPDTGLYYDPVE